MCATSTILPNGILDCGHTESPHSPNTRGYGITADNKTMCYACCYAQEKEYMRNNDNMIAYLSGRSITTWIGFSLMRIMHRATIRHNLTHCRYLTYVHCIDAHGQEWYGKGSGDSMAIRLHKRRTPYYNAATREFWRKHLTD